MDDRDERGRFAKKTKSKRRAVQSKVIVDHNYISGHYCSGPECECQPKLAKHVSKSGWKVGRRIVEFDVLLSGLKTCKFCGLGPVPLTLYSVVGELQRGLGGFLYVRCSNIDCEQVNIVPYGKTHRQGKTKGIPCFVANTKLGTAMIDSLGGPVRVNNFLASLNLKPISNKNLKTMERRAGDYVEKVAEKSARLSALDAFQKEMKDVAEVESKESAAHMEGLIEDLGVCPLQDASPRLKLMFESDKTVDDDEWTDIEEDGVVNSVMKSPVKRRKKTRPLPSASKRPTSRVHLASRFPCRSRTGMSCAVDTAWQKRGFDSLTSHTFFMSKAKYGKKVVKTIVSHRTCGTCKWWRRNRPFQTVRKHRCVHDHTGSAKLMESASGEKGIHELIKEGTPVEVIEGDGDNTLIARLKSKSNIDLKKKFDRNHVVKNIGKSLYALHSDKNTKLSKLVILHIQKCLKYILAKNQGDAKGLEENLKALIPHQFGDHTKCQARWCGFKRDREVKYKHRSLPYKAALKDDNLRSKLEKLFEPVIMKAPQLSDLGSSQQCEHANREVSMRAPKSLHYGNSESLDFRVKATAAFINEGRHYISQVHSEAGLSPGAHTVRYAEKCQKQRKRMQDRSALPSTKRRRLELKQERSVTQCAQEVLEGVSYQSEIGHVDDADIERLPDPVPRGDFRPISLPSGEATYIAFDLETTGLIRDGHIPQITQVAATEARGGKAFNVYVKPTIPISETAQQVTGIRMVGNNMQVKGSNVDARPVCEALKSFCEWLESFDNVVLVAHNGRRFDFPVLITACENVSLCDRLFHCVSGCADSLPVFKKVFAGRTSYKQEDIARDLLGAAYSAHDASEDAMVLGKLIHYLIVLSINLMPFTFPAKAVYSSQLYSREKAKNMPSLRPLVYKSVCKTTTAEHIAGSGLNHQHLKCIYEREGEDGLRNIFIMKNCEGQPRVTNTKRTLDSVIPALALYFSKK